MTGFRTVIGLEVHVQLRTHSKLFSPAPVQALGEPNTRVHAIDLGLPGTLPQPNAAAVALAVRAALALGGAVQPISTFARKNYFYPDLPKGYQISQYERPFCRGGEVPLGDGRTCPLQRIHLEEDAGKLVHTDAGTLIDLNRAGVPLVEIVGEPALHAPADAHAFLVHLVEILRFAGVSDCDMELGSLRCDANVSLMRADTDQFGTRVEIKNLNSFKMVQRALEYEERRQTAILAAGGTITAETRLWNDEKGETRPMRSKETAPDYRYFDDPDLPPLALDAAFVATQRALLGELPAARRARYRRDFGLPDHDVAVLTRDKALGDYFEALASACGEPKTASNWILSSVLQSLGERKLAIGEFPVSAARLGELLKALDRGELTVAAARTAFQRMVEGGGTAATAIAELGLAKIADVAVLRPLVQAAIAASEAAARDVRAGKTRALDALKGHVMRATKGKADAAVVDRLFREELERGPA
jgi:aspartyl-tRNA(Asn)/glutamyl-tRNA(Gln) amidotransferase subunit B